jgi:predicted secreted protein
MLERAAHGNCPRVVKGRLMSIPMSIAVYFTIWWTVLFAVLPFGIRSQHESGEIAEGTDPGAPVAPRLMVKAIVTTAVSAVLFAALYAYVQWMA